MSGKLQYLEGTATPYSASYIILKRGQTIALILRSNTGWMDGNYSLPSGRVDDGESPSTAAIREAHEEVAVIIKPQALVCQLTLHRKAAHDKTFWVDSYFEATEWEGEPINAEPHKHGELKWFAIDALPDNIVPSVKYALQQIAQGATYAEFGWA